MIVVTVAAFLLFGYETGARLKGAAKPDSALERICTAITFGTAAWLLTLWIVALCHRLTPQVLLMRSVVILVLGMALLFRRRPRVPEALSTTVSLPTVTGIGLSVLALSGWCAFVLWRSAIVPPLSHDALAYHLPKALLLLRAEGFDSFNYLDYRIAKLPINYELLLADVMATEGTDARTEWLSTLFYAFFVVAAVTLAERWLSPRPLHLLTVAVLIASTPVLLLHAGAHKNDIFTAAFMLFMMLWSGAWISTGERRYLIQLILATAVAVGTKPQAGLLALALLPFIVPRLVSELRHRRMSVPAALVISGVAVAAFFLLGGVVYLQNLTDDVKRSSDTLAPYGDWRNLWEGPYVLLAAPLSRYHDLLTVPWSDRYWFWQRYEIYFSHFGIWFVTAVALLPFTARHVQNEPRTREALLVTSAAMLCFIAMLPVFFHPHGLYAISLPRYALFLLPVTFNWSLVPLLERLASRRTWIPTAALVVATVVFLVEAWRYGRHDRFVPWQYVLWARSNPGTRIIPFAPNRAASIADRMAGPRETIALDAGFGTWIHPAFGADLRRPVKFIPSGGGVPRIPSDAKWIAIDRSWNVYWGQDRIRDLGDAYRYLGRGTAAPEDVRVLNHLLGDSRFQLVHYNRRANQAVFRRVR